MLPPRRSCSAMISRMPGKVRGTWVATYSVQTCISRSSSAGVRRRTCSQYSKNPGWKFSRKYSSKLTVTPGRTSFRNTSKAG